MKENDDVNDEHSLPASSIKLSTPSQYSSLYHDTEKAHKSSQVSFSFDSEDNARSAPMPSNNIDTMATEEAEQPQWPSLPIKSKHTILSSEDETVEVCATETETKHHSVENVPPRAHDVSFQMQQSQTESENEWSYSEEVHKNGDFLTVVENQEVGMTEASEKQHKHQYVFTICPSILSTICCDSRSDRPSDNISRRKFGWVQISLCIVKTSPCFWCLPRLHVETTTDSTIAYRLIFLVGFLALLQIGQGVFFSITFYEQGSIFTSGNIYFEPNLWNPFFYLMGKIICSPVWGKHVHI